MCAFMSIELTGDVVALFYPRSLFLFPTLRAPISWLGTHSTAAIGMAMKYVRQTNGAKSDYCRDEEELKTV